MADEKIIIDDDLMMNVDSGIIYSNSISKENKESLFPIDEINNQISIVEQSLINLESSLGFSHENNLLQGRQAAYDKASLLTNIVIGIVLALIIIIFLA